MTRALACLATVALSVPLALVGCGGGQTEAPQTTTTTVAAAPAAAVTTTTVAAGKAEEEAAPLLAWADAAPEEGAAPLTVEFNADVEGGTPPLTYKWSFGDGSPDSSEQNPKHTYAKAGKYRADLAVSDSGGDSDSDYIEIEVH
ncbi:MAG TPA: PKD domain-containing protein [Candidatus Binatia bacterium]|nr:PKD domain-containing protein [Candidatus Binatia bacterium]